LAKGVNEIWCVATNDGFVMAHWGRDQKALGKIRFLGDGSARLDQVPGPRARPERPRMGTRMQRFSMLVDDGVGQEAQRRGRRGNSKCPAATRCSRSSARSVRALLLAATLAASTALAQAPSPAPESKDAARKEQREKIHAARQKAAAACKSAKGDEHRDCMQREMCAQAKDPARVARARSQDSRCAQESARDLQERPAGQAPGMHAARDVRAGKGPGEAAEAVARKRAERRKATKPSG
jgi:hypothetical protein